MAIKDFPDLGRHSHASGYSTFLVGHLGRCAKAVGISLRFILLLLLATMPSFSAGIVVESMHRFVAGTVVAITNDSVQSNSFSMFTTSSGKTNFTRTIAVGQVGISTANVSLMQESSIVARSTNFHLNASGRYAAAAVVAPGTSVSTVAAAGTNRVMIVFSTDEESVVRVRSTVSDPFYGATSSVLSSNSVPVFKADGFGSIHNGSIVAGHGEVYRFNLLPGRYQLELNCGGIVATGNQARLSASASYEFEFTAVYTRKLISNLSPVRLLAGRRFPEARYRWPLGAINMDLLETTVVPQECFRCWYTNDLLWSMSTNILESDGAYFLISIPLPGLRVSGAEELKLFKLKRSQ